ncbi:hypothetical protein G3I47_09605, partial [Streptomyces anulatus]|nr:hypothetical protein [Streptomyces anulatus]
MPRTTSPTTTETTGATETATAAAETDTADTAAAAASSDSSGSSDSLGSLSWEELVTSALLGTDRRPPTPRGGPVPADAAAALLDAAALHTV